MSRQLSMGCEWMAFPPGRSGWAASLSTFGGEGWGEVKKKLL
jgi:hypothetical protein